MLAIHRTEKYCPNCKLTKPTSEFYLRKNGTWYAYCKPCNLEKTKDYYHNHDGKRKQYLQNYVRSHKERDARTRLNAHLRRKFGISVNDYERFLSEQGGVCKICRLPDETGRRLAVDHCHKTGIIRGLLCSRCNTLLGKAEDNISLLQEAIAYLSVNFTSNT